MEITGIPLHGLVTHGAVAFGPLAALLALGYVLPPLRERLRWSLLGAALLAGGFVGLAYLSGRAHLDANPELEQLPLVKTHEQRALWALLATLTLTAVTLMATTLTRAGRARLPVDVLLVLAALATLVAVVATGDAGARSVWGG